MQQSAIFMLTIYCFENLHTFIELKSVKNCLNFDRLRAPSARHVRKNMKWKTSNDINIEWKIESKDKVPNKMLRNRLNKAGYRYLKAKTKFKLTIRHKKAKS